MSLTNAPEFFSKCSRTVMAPTLDQDEVDGSNVILTACEGLPISWTAYALATAWHETAHEMRPIAERGCGAYFTRLYDVTGRKPARARRMGNTSPGDGPKYRGRGYVQLTWKSNYERAGHKLGVDLVGNPAKAMDQNIAAKIMRHGMVEGWFTGRGFSRYLPSGITTRRQFIKARRIINGTDKAALIAGYALEFQGALEAGGWR